MRLIEAIQRGTAFLEARGVESPRLQVELILSHVLAVPRLQLYLQFERELEGATLDTVREAIRRRGERVPLQHVLGTTSFCGLEIEVTPDVLVPRPETEALAERAWTWLGARAASGDSVSALDWGTGSGCLAIALAVRVPSARITGLDVSPAALAVAERNAVRHGVAGRIAWVPGDGVAGLAAESRFDLVVSNPPYIPSAVIASLDPEVRDHDPRLALDGGEDGLRLYRRLVVELAGRLRDGGAALVEFGDEQGAAVAGLFCGAGWVVDERHADYSGRERFLLARRAG